MPNAFKVVRDLPVNWAPPGGGVTWAAGAYADDDTITLTEGNGVIGFTVGQTGTYALSLGRGESIGTAEGGIWVTVADSSSSTVALTASTQYYAQGPDGVSRQVKLLLGYRLRVSSSSSSDTGNVYIRGLDAAGVDIRETIVISGTSTVPSTNYYSEIISLTKDETTGTIKISDAQGYWLKMAPKQTVSRFTRVEFDETPSDVADMAVVYKKRVRELLADGDSPQLNSIEQALMTMALGDLYTKTRQLAKAAVKYEEGVNLLEVVRNRESVQQAQNIVLVPEHLGGYQVGDFGWL